MFPTRNPRSDGSSGHLLEGKTVFIPPLAYGSARAFASAFRAVGVKADDLPPSDERTKELGARYTSGDECYPAKVTIGDVMKLLERPDIDARRTVLFHPTADGPCRFGLYGPYLRQLLDAKGYRETEMISPSSNDSYGGIGELGRPFLRTAWRALVSADALLKLLLRKRPYELRPGEADRAYQESLDHLCQTIETSPLRPGTQLETLRECLITCRDRFRGIPTSPDSSRPLIGVVGEIFCRLNTFSNDDLVRRLEQQGGEAWISDVSEWIRYTNAESLRILRLNGKLVSLEALATRIRSHIQRSDEHRLLRCFHDDFAGREEPEVKQLLAYAGPYLPQSGAMGEMVINVGRVIYLAQKGVDGIIDISPFTCMNGIVSEAIYPRLSRDLGGIPIRNFYFDGTQSDLDADLGVFLALAQSYQKRKNFRRAPQALRISPAAHAAPGV